MFPRLAFFARKGHFVKHQPDRLSPPTQPQAERDVHRLAAESVRHILNEKTRGTGPVIQGRTENAERAKAEMIRQAMHDHTRLLRGRVAPTRRPDVNLIAGNRQFPVGTIAQPATFTSRQTKKNNSRDCPFAQLPHMPPAAWGTCLARPRRGVKRIVWAHLAEGEPGERD
jgi:hypothetical protein